MSASARPSWNGLPPELRDALDACWSALDERPWELPDEALQHAVEDALGPAVRVLRGEALDEARRRRPDLAAIVDAEGGTLAIPGRSESVARARLWRALEDARPAVELEWEHVVHLPRERALDAALERHAVLAWHAARSVLPMWLHVHPDDERVLTLLDDLEAAIERRAWLEPETPSPLRHALERETPVADPALTALRAIVLAHDLVTQSEARLERVGLPELCAYAWLDAPAELVPAARTSEPTARAEAWFRWWLAEAVPGAWHAGE